MDFALGVLLLVSFASAHSAQDGSHVRTTDAQLHTAIAEGVARSALFRALVARIDASDVIVYLKRQCSMPEWLYGNLTFMTAAGGRRFVNVRISCALTGSEQVPVLGHELQHAVEVADAPSVVDETTLAAEYKRIGFRTHSGKLTFDSRAAIEAGRRIRVELDRTAE